VCCDAQMARVVDGKSSYAWVSVWLLGMTGCVSALQQLG
jgi:hypothetical protein